MICLFLVSFIWFILELTIMIYLFLYTFTNLHLHFRIVKFSEFQGRDNNVFGFDYCWLTQTLICPLPVSYQLREIWVSATYHSRVVEKHSIAQRIAQGVRLWLRVNTLFFQIGTAFLIRPFIFWVLLSKNQYLVV